MLLFLLRSGPDQFRTGWLIESVLSASLIVLVVRGKEVIPPRGSTRLRERDQVYVLSGVPYHTVVSELFAAALKDDAALSGTHEFSMDARLATVGDVEEFYGVELGRAKDEPLAEYLDRTMEFPAVPGGQVPRSVPKFGAAPKGLVSGKILSIRISLKSEIA